MIEKYWEFSQTSVEIGATLYRQFLTQKELAERAIVQVEEVFLAKPLNAQQVEGNSLLVLQKHLAWVLYFRAGTIAGQDSHIFCSRDESLVLAAIDTPARIWQEWEDGFSLLRKTFMSFSSDRWLQTVDVRGRQVTILEVAFMLLTHVSQHVGQIIMLAKHWAGDSWVPLTVPKTKTV